MGRRQFVVWCIAGFLAAGVLSAVLGASHAHAQSLPSNRTHSSGSSSPPSLRSSMDEPDDSYAAPGIPKPIAADDPGEVPEEEDNLDPTPRAGQRAVVQDGDPNFTTEQMQLRDGIVDVGEPLPPEDGTDPSVVDTRDQEETAIFENPPSGDDPLLFQIEDLDPMRDNRTVRRLANIEPYDPVGIRIGSFVLFPEAEISGAYYSNVFRSPNPSGDWAANVISSARLVSNWSRHALEFRYMGDLSYFAEFDTEDDKAYLLEARGRYDFSSRTNVQALVNQEYAQESRSALDALSIGPRTNVTTDRAEATLNHRFNRLSLQFRGSVVDYSYEDAEFNGIPIVNSDRNYTQTEETVRAAWEFKPTLSVYTEVAVNQRGYDEVATSDGISRSSDGERYRVGLAFGNTGKVLRGEASLGYGVQRPEDSRLHDIDGLLIDANATWRVTELTSLLFNARTDISETTTENVGGSFYRYLGVEARHAFLTYLIGSAGLSYATQDSQDGLIDEREIRMTLGLEYFVNRETVLFTRYAHTDLDAIGVLSDYSADEIYLGMKLRQ
jgi:hypothetical protein